MKRILATILTIGMIVSLTACSPSFDASGYTNSCLDASYHEEYEKYAEFVDCTIEEAAYSFTQQNQLSIENEIAALEKISVTEEQKSKYAELILASKKLTKYEVKEALETDDGYEVPVTTYPVDVYENFKSGLNELYETAADEATLNEETIFPLMLEHLEKCIKNAQYKDPVEMVIHVTKNKSGAWHISEEELYDLDELLLPRP